MDGTDILTLTDPVAEPAPQKMIRSRGLVFPDDPAVITPKLRRLLRRRDYEAREAAAVRALVGKEDVALELGGGIGYMSTLMARCCKAKAVFSFEANPTLIPYIERVYAANKVTTAHVTNALLGPKAGTATFYERANFLASSLSADAPGEKSEVIREHQVDILPIGEVMAEIRPTALVCDIEGAEADLLPLADLSSLRVAVIELHPQWVGQSGVQAVFDAFHAHGLTFYPRTSNKKVVTFLKGW
ncbi:MAG: FkbM family methyltransferase [Maritimibacter sp.]|nr:FkbM family methyltransferase [Maritimibacter sp.]